MQLLFVVLIINDVQKKLPLLIFGYYTICTNVIRGQNLRIFHVQVGGEHSNHVTRRG